jgi:hypothetical protein
MIVSLHLLLDGIAGVGKRRNTYNTFVEISNGWYHFDNCRERCQNKVPEVMGGDYFDT